MDLIRNKGSIQQKDYSVKPLVTFFYLKREKNYSYSEKILRLAVRSSLAENELLILIML